MTAFNKIIDPEDADNAKINPEQSNDEQDLDMDAYIQLNHELDEISNFLDVLEEKNDNLHAEITKLLEESKQIRTEMKSGST